MILDTCSKRKAINFLLKFIHFKFIDIYIHRGGYIGAKTNIGKGCRFNGKITIKGAGAVILGKYCAFGDGIKIISSNHDIHYLNLQYKLQEQIIGIKSIRHSKTLLIGNNVWVGDNVVILPGVQIGDGSIIGAGAIVTRDIPAYSIAVGNPAKVIKTRFNHEIIELIENLEWWNWSLDEMRSHKQLFNSQININIINEFIMKTNLSK